MESSISPAILFNIFMDARYHHVKVVGNETTFRVSIASIGKSIKKSNILFIEKKKRMLVSTYIFL
jgi:hypothetical protein